VVLPRFGQLEAAIMERMWAYGRAVHVREVLEDLQQLTRLSEPSREAPSQWVERLHAVLRVIACPEDQVRFRLGVGQTITIDDLHRRVAGVRYLVDRLTAHSASRHPESAKVVPFAPRAH
jgi:hypothetical protein